LIFKLSAFGINSSPKAVVLLVDSRFVITRQLRGFATKLKAACLPVEISRAPHTPVSRPRV
jgi:hypothetical protein